MTQNEKDILSKDLCARLPYGVKVHFSGWDSEYLQQKEMVDTLYSIDSDGYCNTYEYDSLLELGDIKPYLFPFSSMTMEQEREWQSLMVCDIYGIFYHTIESFDYLYKNHIDIRGLIPMGLANDATGLNIY